MVVPEMNLTQIADDSDSRYEVVTDRATFEPHSPLRNPMKHHLLLGTTLFLALTGCEGKTDIAPPPPTQASTPAPKPVAPRPDVLKPDMVSVAMELEGAPQVNAATGHVEMLVKVTNNGKVALSSESKPPVNLGVQILGTDGTMAAKDAVQNFIRVPLPRVEPGQSTTVTASIPVTARINGRKLNLELVQETVAWFSKFGQPALQVGPFEVCGDRLCEGEADASVAQGQ